MAIFVTDCAICGGKITDETPFVTTSGVAFAPPHPLYPYCDAGLHQRCLASWNHRREFSIGYVDGDGLGTVLKSEDEWKFFCGPQGFGPHGKPRWPYYAEIRLVDWPIRLYSRFEEWAAFISCKGWKNMYIPEINEAIEKLYPQFPKTSNDLKQHLWNSLLNTMLTASAHRSRYIAAVSLSQFDDERILSALPELHQAHRDEHDSVRNAVRLILKRFGKTSEE